MSSSDSRELNPNSDGTNANSHQKSVLVWTCELEEKFLKAYHDLHEEATANQILEQMEKYDVIGLTRRQVSSHLQKHQERCAKDTSLTRYESGQKHLRKLQLKENKTAGKRSAASSFVSKPAQEDCPPTNNGQKRQMITQSDQFNTPNFGDGLYDAGFGSGFGAVGDSTFAGFNHGNYQFPLSYTGVNEQESTSSLTLPSMAQRQFSLGNDEQNDNNNVDYVFDNIAGQQQFGQSVDMLYKPTDYRQFQYHQQQGVEGAPNPSCHAAMNPPISTNTNPLNQPNFTNFGMGSTDKVVLSNPNYDNINNYDGNQLMDLDEILAILDENTANSSNDEPNQHQAGEAEVNDHVQEMIQELLNPSDHHNPIFYGKPSQQQGNNITSELRDMLVDENAGLENQACLNDAGFGFGVGAVGDSTFGTCLAPGYESSSAGFNHGNGQLPELLATNSDDNIANSSNDKPNQHQAGEAEVILQINQPLNDHHDFPSSPFNQRITEEDWDDDDIASIFNDLDPIIPL